MGSGPALVLIMGYRLSSRAWPLPSRCSIGLTHLFRRI
jgi:hypothetical protein